MNNEESIIRDILDSREQIRTELTTLEQLNTSISDKNLASLIKSALEFNNLLDNDPFRGNKNLLRNVSEELNKIVGLSYQLKEYTDDIGKFDEAIQLLGIIKRLYKKYGHEVPLIDEIYKTSLKQTDHLVANLCDRLEHLERDNSTEEEVISIVNNLIRCGNLSQRDLKLKYLQARDSWFNNECEKKSSSFDHVASVYCHSLPMIFNEYKNIFSESSTIKTNKLVKLSSLDSTKEDGAIINSWLLLKTSVFIASLEVYLRSMSQSGSHSLVMLKDTMIKCFKLTDWLASIGFDFSSRLKPLFHKVVIEEVKSSIERVTASFESSFTTIAMKSIQSLLLPIEDDILEKFNQADEHNSFKLPKTIKNYPVFCIYCLNLLDSMRWIQATKDTISPICLCLDTYSALNASMTRVMKALAMITYLDNNSSHPILSRIGLTFITEVLPFFVDYCEKLFPEKLILTAIGLSKAEFKQLCANEPEKVKNFRLDLKQIADPLKMQI